VPAGTSMMLGSSTALASWTAARSVQVLAPVGALTVAGIRVGGVEGAVHDQGGRCSDGVLRRGVDQRRRGHEGHPDHDPEQPPTAHPPAASCAAGVRRAHVLGVPTRLDPVDPSGRMGPLLSNPSREAESSVSGVRAGPDHLGRCRCRPVVRRRVGCGVGTLATSPLHTWHSPEALPPRRLSAHLRDGHVAPALRLAAAPLQGSATEVSTRSARVW
jgi:hypothetical protein